MRGRWEPRKAALYCPGTSRLEGLRYIQHSVGGILRLPWGNGIFSLTPGSSPASPLLAPFQATHTRLTGPGFGIWHKCCILSPPTPQAGMPTAPPVLCLPPPPSASFLLCLCLPNPHANQTKPALPYLPRKVRRQDPASMGYRNCLHQPICLSVAQTCLVQLTCAGLRVQ